MSTLLDLPEPVAPTETDVRIAKDASRKLSHIISERRKGAAPPRMAIAEDNGKGKGELIALPAPALQLLIRLLNDMAAGHAVMLIPLHAELTTQQAADLLGVSRPFVVRQIESGELKHRKVGTHRRIRVQDLVDFKRQMDAGRMRSLDELVAEAQKLRLGY